jgi:hypothetical protein
MSTGYRLHAPVLALVLLAAACSTDQTNPTQDSGIDPAETAALTEAARGAQVQLSSLHGTRIRLYRSNCATSFALIDFVPVIGPDGKPVIGPDGRPIPAQFTVSLSGKCDLRPFGEASLAGTQVVVFNPDGSQSLHNETQYTVAGGDVLYSVFDGTGAMSPTDPTTVTFEAWERFVGGTGQFSHARGGAKAWGSANLATSQGEYRALGVIGY